MKRWIIPIATILFACVAGMLIVGTWHPFAPEARAMPAFTPTPPPPVRLPRRATNTPAATASLAMEATPVALAQVQTTPTVPLQGADLTQTATLAQQTLDAIGSRAEATWTPTVGPSPTPRAIDMTTNILLMGTDLRPNDPTWVPSTDVIMVLFLDTANHRAALLSFPRDLVVAIPHHNAFRINYVYQYGLKAHGPSGGAELVKQVLHAEFGIRIDHWALIDFDGLQKIIDTLGGVDVQVPCPLADTIDNQQFVIPAGNVHMDYLTAKRYVQSRYTTSDTSRNYRQQRILWAIVKKGLQLNALDKVPTLWNQLHDAIQTDMSLFDIVGLVPAAYQLDLQAHPERIHARVLEYPAVYPFIAQDGAWLFMPNYAAIDDRLDHLFDAPEIAASKPDAAECPGPLPTATPTPAAAQSPTVTLTPRP
jgi:LCP family protein required for cell wall assembly